MSKFSWGPKRDKLYEVLAEYGQWMENFLGVPEASWSLHYKGDDKASYLLPFSLVRKVLGSCKTIVDDRENIIKDDISNVQFAPGCRWIPSLDSKTKGRETECVELSWEDDFSVVGFEITKAGIKAIFLRFEYISGPGARTPEAATCIVTSEEDSVKMREYLRKVLTIAENEKYSIYTYDVYNDGNIRTDVSTGLDQSWDNLILDPSILRLVQRDTETFFYRRDWFIKNHIPFRRGYLFHGPPGNGKTSVIKSLLTSLKMNAYKIRLFSSNITDEALERMFRDAQSTGPNMVILEDLDRAFPKTGEKKSPVGLHTLLNCLDGLESLEGVITIATANEPTALDKAILKRPGRFDRVVLFDNPNPGMREGFFLKKAPYLCMADLSPVVGATEGFSFAQLQEAYVIAGQYAYEGGSEDVTVHDIHTAATELRGATNSVSSIRTATVGYK